MVVHLGLRTHELLYKEIDNIIAEIWSAWEKAVCYEIVANHSQCIFTFIQYNNFWANLTFMSKHKSKIIILN